MTGTVCTCGATTLCNLTDCPDAAAWRRYIWWRSLLPRLERALLEAIARRR